MKKILTIVSIVLASLMTSTYCQSQNYHQNAIAFYNYSNSMRSYSIGWYWLENLGWYFFNGIVFCPEIDSRHYYYDGSVYLAPYCYSQKQIIVVSNFQKHHIYKKSKPHHVYHYVQHGQLVHSQFQSHSKNQCERPNPNKPHSTTTYNYRRNYTQYQRPYSSRSSFNNNVRSTPNTRK